MLLLIPNLNSKSNLSNVIMGVNSIINPFTNFAIIGVFIFVFLVFTPLLKMENPKEKFVQLILLFILYYVMLVFPRFFGLTP